MSKLPDYVVADVFNLKASENTTIRQKAKPFTFPLTHEDQMDIRKLILKFRSEVEEGIGSLSGPEIGVSKRVIVFHLRKLEAKVRKCEAFPQTVWLNPYYEQGPGKHLEKTSYYEDCYSVKDYFGPVKRFQTIYYNATEYPTMKEVEGVAHGFTARIIQHGIDHLDGILFVDICPKDKLVTEKEYVRNPRE